MVLGAYVSWDQIGAIGEVVSALAVLVSIVYLAVQIRSNTSQAKAQAFYSVISEQSNAASPALFDQEIAELWIKVSRDEPLSDVEEARATLFVARLVQTYLAIQVSYDKGQIDVAYFRDCKAQMKALGQTGFGNRIRQYLPVAHPNMKDCEIFGFFRDGSSGHTVEAR